MGKHENTKEDLKKNKKKKKKRGLKVLLIILILIIGAGIWFAKRVHDLDGNWLAALMGHDENTVKNLEEIQILLLGESTGMSDTIIVCSYNPQTQRASMLSIPRDTYVGTGCSAYNKINSLYSNGETPEKTLEAVNELTGLNIQYYVLVDTEALIKLVDLIGGVYYDVPIDMKYTDKKQNLYIDLKAGYQKLTGEQVEQLVRFRHNSDGSTYDYEYGMEDYGRMKTQRNLIVAVVKQTIKLKNVTEISNIINIIKEYVKTNINVTELLDYIPYAMNIDADTIQTAQLPGESNNDNQYGIWFFYNDEEETIEIVNQLFGDEEETEEDTATVEENTVNE